MFGSPIPEPEGMGGHVSEELLRGSTYICCLVDCMSLEIFYLTAKGETETCFERHSFVCSNSIAISHESSTKNRVSLETRRLAFGAVVPRRLVCDESSS